MDFGVNIAGYINKQFGLGEGVRANIRAIKTTDVPFVINDAKIQLSKYVQDAASEEDILEHNPYNINLIQINIDKLHDFVNETDKEYFRNRYNIAFWAWELEEFPEESKVFFNLFNEIWVPSNFCAEAISRVSPVPVIKIMHTIEIEKPEMSRKELGLPDQAFIFLGMFDYYSSIHRKNPIGIIDAYEKAFGKNNKEVILVLKSSISTDFPEHKKLILERIGANESIILIEEIMEKSKLYSLMNCCDCFVSLHRSEGFGLTMAEAMYLGKPVIATAYSANTEFMNINNSFLIKYKMTDTGKDYSFVSGKGFWADPDLNHAAEIMQYVFGNPQETQHIALQGKNDVRQNLNPKTIGKKIEKRLRYINDELLPELHSGTSSEETLLQFENKILQQKIDKLKSYAPIRLKLAFKNFKNKITGGHRKYMWE